MDYELLLEKIDEIEVMLANMRKMAQIALENQSVDNLEDY